MFSKLFEERDRKVSLLVKLGDCLGRSLRENTTLFSIDSQNSLVTYLTQSGKVISGTYKIDEDISINKIRIQESSVFKDDEVFDTFVSEKIHTFVEGIHFSEYSSADQSFDDILSLWENRMRLDSVKQRLDEKSYRLENLETIIESDSFKKIIELKPQLVSFLQEKFDKISSVPEVRNAVNLSNVVSTAFDFPKLSYEDLEEGKSYVLKEGVNNSIYEMICRQELVKRELIESKKSFDTIWATNSSVQKLAGMMFEDEEKIVSALAESLQEVPYLALASKKSLFNTFKNCLGQSDGIGVSDKDIQEYASNIFEVKKEAKQMFINMINEKYGVSVQNLQEPASFKSLVNTQVVIFEALSRLAQKGSVLKQVLSEVASSLKNKSGVEAIDVNDFIFEIFSTAGYSEILEEAKASSKYTKIDFKRVAKDLGDVKDLINTLKDQAVVDQEYSSDENVDQDALAAQEAEGAGAPPAPEAAPAPAPAPEAAPAPPPEAAAPPPPVPPEPVPGSAEAPMPEEPAPEMPPEVAPQEDMITGLSDLEAMVADITAEIGGAGKETDSDESGDKKEKKNDKEKE